MEMVFTEPLVPSVNKIKMKFFLVFLGVVFFACKRPSLNNSTATKIKDTVVSIPLTFYDLSNLNFTFSQDTLIFNHAKFSGYGFKLFPNKDTAMLGSFYNGLEQGVFKKWYTNKQVSEIRYYDRGKKVGVHSGFWENGKPKFEYQFKEGEFDGTAKEWYQNGNRYKLFHYQMGYEQGSEKLWWESGVIRANYVVREGRRYGLIGLKLCSNPTYIDSLKRAVKTRIKY